MSEGPEYTIRTPLPKFPRWLRRAAPLGLIVWSMMLVSPVARDTPDMEALRRACVDFQGLMLDLTDDRLLPDSAALRFTQIVTTLRKELRPTTDSSLAAPEVFVFPLRGYIPHASIGGRGRGYKPDGFNLFDNTVRKSHPAHDLFIKDRNQDGIEDVYCQPVDVLSATEGWVVGLKTDWQPDSSASRGGNYIWVYDPALDGLFYYAHNSSVVVTLGQRVQAGEKIAEVGRTGFNAHRERSPTHLHFMFVRLDREGLPQPENPYTWLVRGQVTPWY